MIEVEGGNDFSCARKSDGSVYCWGSDQKGQLGDGNFGKDYTVARKVTELSDASDTKFGIGFLYNINRRSAVTFDVTSSNKIDNTFRIGYQINL